MSDQDREPFDEQEYLRLLTHLGECHLTGRCFRTEILARFLQLSHVMAKENIRLREQARADRERASLLEQGQQPLFPPTSPTQANHNPATP